jgi:hypothetical protein
MTPLFLAIAAGVVVIVGLGIVIALRARGVDEGARFRHVADLTSAWSRQSGGDPTAPSRQSGARQTDRPLPYPESTSDQSDRTAQADATALGRPPTSGR